MTHTFGSFCNVFALLFLMLTIVAPSILSVNSVVVGAMSTVEQPPATAAPIRSLMHACRAEWARQCGKKMTIECFHELIDGVREHIEDPVCKAWSVARKDCFDAVEKDGCNIQVPSAPSMSKESVKSRLLEQRQRRCLRSRDPDTLPASCKDTGFYKSVMRLPVG